MMQKINKAMKIIERQYQKIVNLEYQPVPAENLVEAQTILFDVLQELRARER